MQYGWSCRKKILYEDFPLKFGKLVNSNFAEGRESLYFVKKYEPKDVAIGLL